MKKYVFITLNLSAMNGADMYIYNKTCYLKEKGYEVFVFSGVQGEVMIHGLSEYKKYQNGYLRIYPGSFKKKNVEETLEWIKECCNTSDDDEIMVESSNIISAMWGELVAEKLNCRHLAILLTERFSFTDAEKAFIRYKLERHELSGIAKESVFRMLGDPELKAGDDSYISASCANTIDQCEDTISDKLDINADHTYCSIGRLDKKYVLPLAGQLSTIFKRHEHEKYNLVLIGGTRSDKQAAAVRAVFSDNENVNLIMTGAMFPIPIDFVKRCDLFISASGSANASFLQKMPTIRLNPDSGAIVGIPGLTYDYGIQNVFESNYQLSELENMIDKIDAEKDNIRYVDNLTDGTFKKNMATEFERQLSFGHESAVGMYYDTYLVKHENKNYKAFNILGKFMSGDKIERSMEFMRKILK